MKKFNSLLAIVFALTGFMAFSQEEAPVIEENKEPVLPSMALKLEWDSRYVSKGRVLNPDAVANLDAYIEYYGFYFDMWNEFDMTSFNDEGDAWDSNRRYRPEEIDYTLGYNYKLGTDFSPIIFNGSWMYMQYPRMNRDYDCGHETEVTLDICLENVLDKEGDSKLAFGGQATYHLEGYCFYGNFYSEFKHALTEKITAGCKTTLFWREGKARHNSSYSRPFQFENGIDHTHGFAFTALEVKPYVKYAFNDYLSAQAFVAGSFAINEKTRKAWKDDPINNNANYWCGISVSAEW